MKKRKTLLIIIIILIILLILGGGAFAYIYFGTDLLKTDKELFAKYFVQMGDEEDGMFPKSFIEYENKKLSYAYTTNGSFSAVTNILSDTTNNLELQAMSELIDYGNSTNITFSGNVDSANKRVEQNISINYNDSVSLPFKYKQIGDIYGLQADFVSPGYISIENNNLQELFQKLGVTDISTIPNKIETQEITTLQFTDEELTHIQESYVLPMFNGLAEDKFSKVENEDGSISYVLSLTNIQIRDIIVNMLQTLNSDTMMLSKINSIIAEVYGDSTVTIDSTDIQELINELTSTNLTETAFDITVTQNNGITNSLSINSGDINIEMLIDKSDSNIVYTFNFLLPNNGNISMKMSYSGINTNTVTEAIEIDLNITNVLDTTYSFDNTVNFDNSINIEDFNTDSIVLNNYTAEQIQPLLVQVTALVVQTNNSQMTQIAFPQELGNPMIMWIAGPNLAIASNSIINNAQETISNSSLQEQEIAANNAIFTAYEGIISGATAKTLCDTVSNYNLTSSSNEQINVKLGENASATSFALTTNDVNQIKNSILSGSTYNVTLSYDATTGYVCEIGIVATN